MLLKLGNDVLQKFIPFDDAVRLGGIPQHGYDDFPVGSYLTKTSIRGRFVMTPLLCRSAKPNWELYSHME